MTNAPSPASAQGKSLAAADLPTAPAALRIRPEVAALPRYVPGQAMPGAVKLSSNENPYPPAPSVIDEASDAVSLVNRYPDLTAAPVRAALSAHLGMSADHICVGAGSSAVLLAALTTISTPEAEVIFPWRSFESYPIAVPAAGATPRPVPLTARWEHDLPAMLAAITPATAAIILCTPNNPTGTALTLKQISDFLRKVPPHILVLIDEAYIEFSTTPDVTSALPLLSEHPNALILRTFSKAYGLAGMRVGYGVGHPDLIGAIQAVSIPFGVSGPAQAAAVAVLQNTEGIAAGVRAITEERTRMSEALRALGWDVPDSQANFLWLPQAPRDLFRHCREGEVLVRPFPEGIRVSIGTPEENDRALAFIASYRRA
ncbi:histidinol-phosphate transaminase [Schaalia sp. Marseille-Q2122]|uniref:histidinol-phosphate transaminase n=1 Tax=Schaalia sp. Marseille-Q2122 TaxID=2736604 RepID=UPI00158F0BA1|nr:histidinol-phosphate transaminase [Schaalia sp. Marseille-Q2122]